MVIAFLGGIIVTVAAEAIGIIVYAIVYNQKRGDR